MNGWVPDQHGAWPMGFMPLIAGVVLADKTWTLLLLVLAWTFGFFLFNASEKWLKSRFRVRYRPAVITYAVLTALFGIPLIILAPHLLWWALLYVPIIAYWAYHVWTRDERALSSRVGTIFASSLIAPVAVNLSIVKPWFSGGVTNVAWLFAGLLGVYFMLTVPYVKTLIRERGSSAWLAGSFISHALAVGMVIGFAVVGWVSWLHVVVWFGLLARAVIMPLSARRRRKPWKPMVIGPLEVVISFCVLLTLPWSLTI